MTVKVNHFIPLIGPFIIGVDNLKKEGYNLKNQDIVSYSAFKANEQHIENNNYGKVHYLPNDLNGGSINQYKKYIKENNIHKPDLICSVPPCSGLSLLNNASSGKHSRGGEAIQNNWIYESVKFYLANEAKVLLLENAPGLIGRNGLVVLKNIKQILTNYNSGYKMHLTKTTTLQHGLPQDRKRTFLYIYRSENYKIFKQLNRHRPITLEDFMKMKNRPKKYDNSINHQTLKNTYSDIFFKFIKKIGLIKQFREDSKDKKIFLKTAWQYLMPLYLDKKLDFTGFPKLKSNAERNAYKLSIGKGYWDGSPLFIKGKSNAVISKNAFRTLHPYYNRYLSVREYMDLMGFPDDFVLKDPARTFNHICQSVPITTAMDHILWAIGIIGAADTISDKEYKDNISAAFIQDNMKDKIETTFKIITPEFKEIKDVKSQNFNFYNLF